jgi:hypothetical protein
VEQAKPSRRRLIVPVVLVVSVVGAIATLSATAGGCGNSKPPIDAAVIDVTPDTPVV